jgi:hypothetical protein
MRSAGTGIATVGAVFDSGLDSDVGARLIGGGGWTLARG